MYQFQYLFIHFKMKKLLYLAFLLSLWACQTQTGTEQQQKDEPEWQSLFNGENLDGWTPKFAGAPLGENYKNTFQVENGLLKVSYVEYDTFRNEFGHLFYEDAFSKYILRVEYRFVGEQVPNGPGWAFKNSGAMLHSQAPESMEVDQGFPNSIEAQFLGGNGTDERPTGNLCTPGTHVYLADTLFTPHCIISISKTYHGEEWVQMDMIVYADSLVHHVVNGDTVITYTKPHLGGNGAGDKAGQALKEGFIALQAESHPIEFRKVDIKTLD